MTTKHTYAFALGWFVGPPKNVSPKKVLVSLNGWVSRKGTFSKNASKRGEFQIVKKTTCPVLLFENVCYLKHFWKKCLF